ncbi:hypothetical protein INT43_002190 [Umbelopsis isabellina]|uniref:DH domain-containing protein n=1 Tax=Mortierella isabellina TaxID=91625 RepID=A0A8H7Q570_MORIS|nr:hypothetical protein INT43_002190 [Umbelopsis isabellina]
MLRRRSKDIQSTTSSSGSSFYPHRSSDSLSRTNTITSARSNNSSIMQEKLLEDMSIIDDLYNDFADQVETDFYEVEVRYRDREQSIQDIYASEIEYLALLQHGSEMFEQKMRVQVQQQSKKGGILSGNKIICTDQDINILFGNHHEILAAHRRFLEDLEERFRIWGPTQLISDVFRDFLPKLAMCTQKRLQTFAASVMALDRLMKLPIFRKFIEACQTESAHSHITLMDIFKAQVQRLTSYAPSLRALAQNTDPLHPDYTHMLRCTTKFEALNQDMYSSLDDISRLCDAYEATLIIRESPLLLMENRRLYLRGDLIKLTGSDNSHTEPRAVFLFNDILIHGRLNKDGTVAYRGQIELTTSVARASNTESNKRSHCFEVIATEKQVSSTMAVGGAPNMLFSSGSLVSTTQVSHMFQARSREEQSMWVTELQRLISNCKEKKAKFSATTTIRQSSDVPPSLSRSTTSSSSSTAASGGEAFDLRGKPLYKKMNSKSSTRGINSHEFMP